MAGVCKKPVANRCVLSLFAVAAAAVAAIAQDDAAVKVSSFGSFDAEDSTETIQKALDSGAARIVFDRQVSPWVTRPVYVRSNTEVIFEEGVELQAKSGAFRKARGNCLMSIVCASNVTLRALGKGGVLRMRKRDYQRPPYSRSEWRHALSILSSKNVVVENMGFVDSGGDGIYLGVGKPGVPNEKIKIRNCVCDGNHRQGISVISADGLLIENTVLKNTSGTAPASGIDFEPNESGEKIADCVMRNCLSENNDGAGYEIYLANLDAGSAPVSITLENCRSSGNKRPSLPVSFRTKDPQKGTPKGGFLKVKGCRFADRPLRVVLFNNKPAGSMDVSFEDCIFAAGASKSKTEAPVMLATRSFSIPFCTDGFSFKNVEIHSPSFDGWICASERPWLRKQPRNICGELKIVCAGKSKIVRLGEAWCRERFPDSAEPVNVDKVAFDPASVREIVDPTPDKTVSLSPVRLRSLVRAWFHADSPREILFTARQFKVSRKRPLKVNPIEVYNAAGGKIASLDGVGEEFAVRSFRAPEAGFYRVDIDGGQHGVMFAACNAPVGFIPANKKGFLIFQTEAQLYFHHPKGAEAALFCGGGGGEAAGSEVASFSLCAPSGRSVRSWDNLGDWGFFRISPESEQGLWKLD
ncbi:MAG: right-handed parallel beta-helix repeat-containing protein, partial [Kiritimatiellae bacterium]|nr:right-handed parallel beta-helix repeat-containing protein [Kiritimatiellia bacterium]